MEEIKLEEKEEIEEQEDESKEMSSNGGCTSVETDL